jgi:hypothetical protein
MGITMKLSLASGVAIWLLFSISACKTKQVVAQETNDYKEKKNNSQVDSSLIFKKDNKDNLSNKTNKKDSLKKKSLKPLTSIRVACFLNLETDMVEDSKHSKAYQFSMEYLKGMLIAQQNLYSEHKDSVFLYFYDIDKSIWNSRTIADSLKQKNINLVFLPLKDTKNEPLLKACAQLNIPIVSPYQTQLKSDSQLIFYSNSSEELKIQKLIEYYDSIPETKLLFFDKKANTDSSLYATLKKYEKLGKISSIKDLTTLSEDCKNKAIFLPFRAENLSLRYFTEIRTNCIESKENIRIIGLYSWLFYNSMEPKIWEEYQLTLLSDYFVDFYTENTKLFLNQFRKTYLDEPTYWSFIGHDDFLFFANKLMSKELITPNFSTDCMRLTQGIYQYQIDELNHSYYNQKLHILKFKDWTFQIQNPCMETQENNK